MTTPTEAGPGRMPTREHARCMRSRSALNAAGHRGCTPLTAAAVPGRDRPWAEVWSFALTFDGYGHLGNDHCGVVANAIRSGFFGKRRLPDDLATLRSCLFYEQRRCRFLGDPPDDDDDRLYVDALLDAIRAAVAG